MGVDLLANKAIIGYNVVNRLGETVWGSDSRSACMDFMQTYWEKDCVITTVYGTKRRVVETPKTKSKPTMIEPIKCRGTNFRYTVTSLKSGRTYTGTSKEVSTFLGVSQVYISSWYLKGGRRTKGRLKDWIITRKEV